ncbi:hypothetical protein Rs2_45960 [Raphanus sativus]|nr:hypothetical protein Rs2_45960 [Raphanus sativus]
MVFDAGGDLGRRRHRFSSSCSVLLVGYVLVMFSVSIPVAPPPEIPRSASSFVVEAHHLFHRWLILSPSLLPLRQSRSSLCCRLLCSTRLPASCVCHHLPPPSPSRSISSSSDCRSSTTASLYLSSPRKIFHQPCACSSAVLYHRFT